MQNCDMVLKNSDTLILTTEDFQFWKNKKLCTETPIFLDIDSKLVTISDLQNTFTGWDFTSFPAYHKATIYFEEKSKNVKRKAEYFNNSDKMKYLILNKEQITYEIEFEKILDMDAVDADVIFYVIMFILVILFAIGSALYSLLPTRPTSQIYAVTGS